MQTTSALSLFCKINFIGQSFALGGLPVTNVVPESEYFTQGRLHCTQRINNQHRIAGFTPFSSKSYQNGSPRKLGRDLHAVARRPKILTLSNSPDLGNQSHHQKLHRYARRRYFTPAFGRRSLTRILHHRSQLYIIILFFNKLSRRAYVKKDNI